MKIILHKLISETDSYPYEELTKAFENFEFAKETYNVEGIVRGKAGYNSAEIKIIVENKNSNFNDNLVSWEVSEKQIPIEFFDAIISTIKRISNNSKKSLVFRIVDGKFDIVDVSLRKFEFATYRAIANLINFNNQNK